MNVTVMDSPRLALAALKKNEGLLPVSWIRHDTKLFITCADEAAFCLDLVLHDAREDPPNNEIWNKVLLKDDSLIYECPCSAGQISFSRAQVQIRWKDYSRNLFTFAPYHYLRDSFSHLLEALKTKSEYVGDFLTPEEKRLLPLCDLCLFDEKKKRIASPLLQKELGIRCLPLKEDPQALYALERLQELLGEKSPMPRELLEKADTPEAFELSFGVKRLRVSLGLKTHTLIRKQLRCLVSLMPCDENILVYCGTTDRKEISRPTECALDGKGFRCFEVYAVKRQDFSREILQEILRHACLQPSQGQRFALTRRPKLFVPAVFFLSGLLWGGILCPLAHGLSLAFPALSGASGLLALGVGVFTLLRFFFYATSVKR